MLNRLGMFLFTLCVGFSVSVQAADYKICNETFEDIFVAYGSIGETVDPVFGSGSPSYIESKGWYELNPNACKDFTIRGTAYFMAKGHLRNYIGNKIELCTKPNDAFDFSGETMVREAKCNNAGGEMIGFYQVRPGRFNFQDNRTYTKVCNKTTDKIYFSRAYFSSNRWTSNGWYELDDRKCRTLEMGTYSGDMYFGGFRVTPQGAKAWNGPDDFCVHGSDAFQYDFADSKSCDDPGQERLGMYKLRVSKGIHTFNFNP